MTHGTMDSLSSPEHRANRLKALREMSGLSREAVKKYALQEVRYKTGKQPALAALQ